LRWNNSALEADHFRFLSTSHSRPVAATIKTTMMLHGVDEAGSWLGVVGVSFASGSFFGAIGRTNGGGLGAGVDATEASSS
jgi:hypothetical protein